MGGAICCRLVGRVLGYRKVKLEEGWAGLCLVVDSSRGMLVE